MFLFGTCFSAQYVFWHNVNVWLKDRNGVRLWNEIVGLCCVSLLFK